MVDVVAAIEALVPGAEYGGTAASNTQRAFNRLRWYDNRAKPAWADIEAWTGPTQAERAAEVTLTRLTFQAVLAEALTSEGATYDNQLVTARTVDPYVTQAVEASTDLSATDKDIAIWLILNASAFWRGDPTVVAAPNLTSANLLDRVAAILGFGLSAFPDGYSPTWTERLAAASVAVDQLFLLADGQTP